MNLRSITTSLALLAMATLANNVYAAGVTAGSSALFTVSDYTDTFTGTDDGGIAGRPYIAAGLPAYPIEDNHGNPSTDFIHQPGSVFSIASDRAPDFPGFVQGSTPPYPGPTTNASGAGSVTGFTQTGGNNLGYGVEYYLRDEYWVQADVIQVTDRVDITSGDNSGGGMIFRPNSISVFFRGDGSGNASVFNGTTDTGIAGQPGFESFNTGIAAWNDAANGGQSQWYNYAVRFDKPDNEIELYVNEVSKAVIDLDTFAGGIYSAGFSNQLVSLSTNTGDRTWTDNFQVGGNGPTTGLPPVPLMPHPDPGDLAPLPANLHSFWDFNEAAGPVESRTLNFAYDRTPNNRDGSFAGATERTIGIVGAGAGKFNDTDGEGVNVGSDFSFTDGVAVEALFISEWDGSDQAEFFRKEDGGNRILLSFQAAGNINDAFGQLVGTANTPGISLGLNVNGGYAELDVAFDGLDDRPSLEDVSDGEPHHIVGTYDAETGAKEIYFDGVLIGSFDYGGPAPLATGGGAAGWIGSSNGGEPVAGILDEVAIYNSGLTQADIGTHLTNVLGGGPNYFNAVPEPGSASLILIGLMGVMRLSRRRS